MNDFESIRQSYLEHVIQQNRLVSAQGVMTSRDIELTMEEIFVPLTVQLESEELEEGSGEDNKKKSKKEPGQRIQKIKEKGLSLDDLWQKNSRWVILGDPGGGKTTVLRHTTWQLAQTALSDPDAPVPLLIAMRNLTRAAVGVGIYRFF